ncbi:hypothetical protein [Mycobacterium sp. 155]|uniref:hypothetical protein n=1 Tax=Mycobacterium sp. 155 TaxID=1157943 RepID=UPI000380F66D|nr:hypothetical protein [Mycobacterium sp. 155]
MTQVRTLRFHTEHGPAPLFDKAREQLKGLAGLNLEIPHAQSRFDEREIPRQYLTDFQPELWEVVTVETAVRTGRIVYMSLRRKLDPEKYLWIVLASEHVITAWVRERPSTRAAHPLIVKDGPAWDAAAEGREPAITGAMAEWADAYARRVRAHRVLVALAATPERPSGDRLAHAAERVLSGSTWNEAAATAGWAGRAGMDAAIARLLRAVRRSSLAGGDG